MLLEKCFSQLIHSTHYQNRPILPPTPMRSEPKSSLKRLDAPSACGWTDSDMYYYLLQKRVTTSILFYLSSLPVRMRSSKRFQGSPRSPIDRPTNDERGNFGPASRVVEPSDDIPNCGNALISDNDRVFLLHTKPSLASIFMIRPRTIQRSASLSRPPRASHRAWRYCMSRGCSMGLMRIFSLYRIMPMHFPT